MVEWSHQFGSDLQISATGDIATVDGLMAGQQRVLRRLLTNPGDYIWHPEYGAGLAGFIGTPADVPKLKAVIRSQMYLEACVSRSPSPVIDVTVQPTGTVTATIQYVDANVGTTVTITLPTGG